jgi:hypothetical protein
MILPNVILMIFLAIFISYFLKRTQFITPLMALVTIPLWGWFIGI